ncbi:MAG TPA: HEAT repeat domain-containing protein [Pyrinomonadaceae bacterium]|nr:HEAT repeat domain-containing protein [Pyrinomonadaceae bacterium]
MNYKKRLFGKINESAFKSAAFLLIAAGIFSTLPEAVYASTPNQFVAARNIAVSDDAFDKTFREGRDLIDKEEWAKAAEKFTEVIGKYPNDKSTDAALYWLAFCHKKQKQFKETDATLDRLLKEFPASSWANDARVMKMEIGFPLGKIYSASSDGAFSQVFVPGAVSPVYKTNVVNALSAYTKSAERMGEGFTAASQTPPLDREDEIKIAAFQSLLAADPKRAIEVMGDVLTSGSKASETFKREVLRVLRSPRVSGTQSLNFTVVGGVGRQFLPLLRETLVNSFQKESNIKIRKEIIYALANINDDQSADYLARLYASENDKEIKKAIINSFGSQNGVFYQFGNASAAFGAASSGGVSKRKIEFDKLLEIIRAEKDGELRRLAFSKLRRFGSSANERVLEDFVKLYDAETDEEFKVIIIRAFADIRQNQATTKLLDIARNDKSDKLKLEAIYALRTSKNPEALKFLEDLIK